MWLIYQLTRLSPGNGLAVFQDIIEFDDPQLHAADLYVTFQPDLGTDRISCSFRGDATLYFIDGDLNAEYCSFRGFFSSLPGSTTTLYDFCVIYSTLQGSTPGLNCTYRGQMQLPGPVFDPSPSLPSDLLVIQPTPQQLQNRDMLFIYGHRVASSAVDLIIKEMNYFLNYYLNS